MSTMTFGSKLRFLALVAWAGAISGGPLAAQDRPSVACGRPEVVERKFDRPAESPPDRWGLSGPRCPGVCGPGEPVEAGRHAVPWDSEAFPASGSAGAGKTLPWDSDLPRARGSGDGASADASVSETMEQRFRRIEARLKRIERALESVRDAWGPDERVGRRP